MKYHQIYSRRMFIYVYHHHAENICYNIHKNSSQFLKTWQFVHMVLPKRPDGDTEINLNLHLVKYSCLLLICITIHLFCMVLQNNLIPRMHHYYVYYLRTFLQIFIFGSPASNTVINSSTLSCASNILLTPLFTTSHDLWNLYHNFGTFLWYQNVHHDW